MVDTPISQALITWPKRKQENKGKKPGMGKGKNSPGRLPLLRERWTGCVAKTLFKSRAEQVPHDRVAARGEREVCAGMLPGGVL